jgi:hypothetical protein
MTEADWFTDTDFSAHAEFAANHLSPRRQRLLAAGFCRAVAHLFDHPDLTEALLVLERYADRLIPEGEAEKVRQRWRERAQQGYERYRASVDSEDPEGDPNPRNHARAEVAWAVAFAFNYHPVPVAEIVTRTVEAAVTNEVGFKMTENWRSRRAAATAEHALVMRSVVWEVVGNPFRPVSFAPDWRTDTAVALARQMYESRDFSAMPILADALQDAGCENDEVLTHCRNNTLTHSRGCWVVDGVLGVS